MTSRTGSRFARKRSGIVAACAVVLLSVTAGAAATQVAAHQWNPTPSNVFHDDFNGSSVDGAKWLIAAKQWPRFNGNSPLNGGVLPENVSVSGGNLRLQAHGDQYTGPGPIGLNTNNTDNNLLGARRTGAAIATRDYYASGRYDVRAKIAQVTGVSSAFWTFHYEEYYPANTANAPCPLSGNEEEGFYYVPNHEIDIETVWQGPSSVNGRFATYRCETQVNDSLTNAMPTDGQYHTYSIIWHTNDPASPGNGKPAQRVEILVDNVLKWTSTQHVPTRASRLWLGIWFPSWAGTPNFNTADLLVDSVTITPYGQTGTDVRNPSTGLVTQEIGDHWVPETYPELGWSNSYHRPRKTPLDATFGSGLNPSEWLIANKNWGGQYDANNSFNGGVVPDNVTLANGNVILEAHGSRYNGLPLGINKRVKAAPPAPRQDGKLVGSAIATADHYGPGRYEVRLKAANAPGVSTAIWTFHYQELYAGESQPVQPASLGWPDYQFQCLPVGCPGDPGDGYYAINHEIDIELPGRSSQNSSDFSFRSGLFNTWTGENTTESTVQFKHNTLAPQNDGQFHDYAFEWHTNATDGGPAKRVDFFVDGVKVATSTTHIPTRASRLWIAAWFPQTWAGTANFDTAQVEVSNVKITPYVNEPVDWFHEPFEKYEWASDLQYPTPTATPSPTPTQTTASPTPSPTTSPTASPTPSPSPTGTPGNLVTNGDFETGTATPTGWNCTTTGPTATAALAAGEGNPGNALRLTPSDPDTAECTQTLTGLTPGHTYTATVDLRSSEPGQPYIYYRIFNGGQTHEVNSRSITGYERKTFTFVAQATNIILSLQAYKQQTGNTYADNVTITG